MSISVLGIDLAKTVFQLHGNDAGGRCVFRKQMRRAELKLFMAQLPLCTVAMEACSSSQYWAREFRSLGHKVLLIAPQFVKPFVKTNKNDSADAEAIAEAVVRPNMRFVPIKEVWQQEVQALHRARSLLISSRVATSNSIRGFLSEQGFVVGKGDSLLEKALRELWVKEDLPFSELLRGVLETLWRQFEALEIEIEALSKKIEKIAKNDERCARIQKIQGIGPLTATAIVAAIGDAKAFKNGRQLSAYLGLVPRQSSSGGRQNLLGISKRGDGYVRSLLIHGARSAIQFAEKHAHEDRRARWVLEKAESRGMNKATVALANRNARVIWALLAKNEEYRMAA